jgi:hypothetical protein
MMFKSHPVLSVAVVLAALISSARAASADYVVNGGFETGDFTGWTISGDLLGQFGVDNHSPYQGTFAAFFGTEGDMTIISQDIPTIVGATYTLTYALMNEPTQGLPQSNEVAVSFGSASTDQINLAAFDYTIFTLQTVATSTTTTLQFGFRNDNSFFDLDAVSVVPEPAGLTLLGIGGAIVVGYGRRRPRSDRAQG